MREDQDIIQRLKQSIKGIDHRILEQKESERKELLQEDFSTLSKQIEQGKKQLEDSKKLVQEINDYYEENKIVSAEREQLHDNMDDISKEHHNLEKEIENLREIESMTTPYREDLKFFNQVMDKIANHNIEAELLEQLHSVGGELFKQVFDKKYQEVGGDIKNNEFKMREILTFTVAELIEDRKNSILKVLGQRLDNFQMTPSNDSVKDVESAFKILNQRMNEAKEKQSNRDLRLAQIKNEDRELSEKSESNKQIALNYTKKLLNKDVSKMSDNEIEDAIADKLKKLNKDIQDKEKQLSKLMEQLSQTASTILPSQSILGPENEKAQQQNTLRKAKAYQPGSNVIMTSRGSLKQDEKKGENEINREDENRRRLPYRNSIPDLEEGLNFNIDNEVEILDMGGADYEQPIDSGPTNATFSYEISKQNTQDHPSINSKIKATLDNLLSDDKLSLSLQSEEIAKVINEAFDLRLAKELQQDFHSLIKQELEDRKLALKLQSEEDHELAKRVDQMQNDEEIAIVMQNEENDYKQSYKKHVSSDVKNNYQDKNKANYIEDKNLSWVKFLEKLLNTILNKVLMHEMDVKNKKPDKSMAGKIAEQRNESQKTATIAR